MSLLSRYLQQRRLSKVRRYLRGAVLDLGCGDASLLALLSPGQSYTGVDRNVGLVRTLQRTRPSCSFVAADLEAGVLPLQPERYDTVVMSAVIEHLMSPAGLLGSVGNLIADGGRLVITTPTPVGDIVHRLGARVGLFSREAVEEHARIYGKRSLEALLSRHRFFIEHYETFELGLNQLCVASPVSSREGGPSP